MKFTKMHGIGNDYVYVNCLTEQVRNPEQVSGILGSAQMVLCLSGRRLWQILKWRFITQTVPGQKCVETGFAVWQSMCMTMD